MAFIIGALLSLTLAPLSGWAAFAGSKLTGSNFEIDTDANLVRDDGSPSIDWASVTETRQIDTPSGTGDNAFGQGTKEDDAVPTVVSGGIPPNKSDLKVFGANQEGAGTSSFLQLFWTRVQDPSGTTNMDFEFNQSAILSGNGVTPVRTIGDILIEYHLDNGGTQVTLSKRIWGGSAWGAEAPLGVNAIGSINSSAILAADADGLGALSARTFGEASIALSTFFGGSTPTQCLTFGSATLKSRSSDSFTSAIKDFIAPVPVNISNCGAVKITKSDDATPAVALAGAIFTLYHDAAPVGGSAPGVEDSVSDGNCTTAPVTGQCTIPNVIAGEYWAVETTTPAGHDTAAPQHVTVVAGAIEPVSLTFVDKRLLGAIKVTKTRKHAADGAGDHPHQGINFTVNGVTKATDANGVACFDNLVFGDYTVSEGTHTGYLAEGDKNVTVDNKASCSDNPYVGETESFHNIPLTDIFVTGLATSQVSGATQTAITCAGPSINLVPGTYQLNCSFVVDP